jgi:hypothetical protein
LLPKQLAEEYKSTLILKKVQIQKVPPESTVSRLSQQRERERERERERWKDRHNKKT